MNAVEKLQKQHEIGQPIFEQFFSLSDKELKEKVKSVCMNGKGVVDIIDNNCEIKRIIINEKPYEILISYYDSIKLNWQGIHYVPEHGSNSIIIHFNEFFNPNWHIKIVE